LEKYIDVGMVGNVDEKKSTSKYVTIFVKGDVS